jgi:phenylalanyl-tRNA synthetase beta chain
VKVPLSWLREVCPTSLGAEALADLLTSRGAEVEEIVRPWAGLEGVLVARVLDVREHPRSEKLCLALVDAGDAEVEVVVGVRNMVAGDLVPLAPPGSRVPALPGPMERREIRGVVSNGMLCSPRELLVSQDHGGILVLPPDLEVGSDLKSTLGLDDAVLDIAVTPNRPDLMSIVGVAREVSAATGDAFVPPSEDVDQLDEPAAAAASVEILDIERCPHYLARVIRGVAIGPSPLQTQIRLSAAGMRPLSNVVDATNYVLLEMGHPLHPFDLGLLQGAGIVVRVAHGGERLHTLDGTERELSEDDLLIADKEKGVAIAGVMGSATAEVREATRDVLLESAYFERTGVARTARRLGLRTEASARFERGADPEAVPRAAARAANLIARWSGGSVLAGVVEEGATQPRRRVSVRPERASALLAYDLDARAVREALGRIRIEAEEAGGVVVAEIPGFRPDLELEVDLIEEVARVRGYEEVGATMPAIRQPGGVPASYALRQRVRDAMAASGFRETTSYSFASRRDLELVGESRGVLLANPISGDEEYLRPSLLPGLLRAARSNFARQVRSVALFEVGHVFRHADPVDERERVAFVAAGEVGRGYPEPPREVEVFDAKGALEMLFERLGIEDWRLGDPLPRPFHPTRSAVVLVGGEVAGGMGELAPRVAEDADLRGRVAVAELDASILARHLPQRFSYRDAPRFPPVRRDLAFVVAEDVAAGRVRDALLESGGGLVDEVVLFDVFAGSPLPEGRKNLAYAVDFRAADRTLTDEEVDGAVAAIVASLSNEFGAEFRST